VAALPGTAVLLRPLGIIGIEKHVRGCDFLAVGSVIEYEFIKEASPYGS